MCDQLKFSDKIVKNYENALTHNIQVWQINIDNYANICDKNMMREFISTWHINDDKYR